MSIQPPKFFQQATVYDRVTPIQSAVAIFLARQLVQYTSLDGIWLDVGCGTGKLSEAVLTVLRDKLTDANQAYEGINEAFGARDNLSRSAIGSIQMLHRQLVGIDNAQTMLGLWQARCQDLASVNDIDCNTLLADMLALPVASQSVDGIMSSFALHWTSPQVLHECGRVLRSGSQLHVAIPVLGSLTALTKQFPQLPIFEFLPSARWQAAIDTLVMERQASYLYHIERDFSHPYVNLKALLIDLKQMGGAVSSQSPISTAVLRRYLQDSASVSLNYQMLLVGIQLS